MIHQIEINKISQTATVVPDLNVGELDRLLSIEGFVSGYLPIEGVQPTLEECVMERKPNL